MFSITVVRARTEMGQSLGCDEWVLLSLCKESRPKSFLLSVQCSCYWFNRWDVWMCVQVRLQAICEDIPLFHCYLISLLSIKLHMDNAAIAANTSTLVCTLLYVCVGGYFNRLWACNFLLGQEVASYWYSTVRRYNYFKDINLLHTNVNAGHFTQMVWVKTKYFGIGKATSKTGKIFVAAFYLPRGDYFLSFYMCTARSLNHYKEFTQSHTYAFVSHRKYRKCFPWKRSSTYDGPTVDRRPIINERRRQQFSDFINQTEWTQIAAK